MNTSLIIQKVILARNAVLMIKSHLILLSKLTENISTALPTSNRVCSLGQQSARSPTPKILLAWQQIRDDRRVGEKRPGLVYWLDTASDARCNLEHDNALSILELAEEGCDITVDYSVLIVRLAFELLKVSEHKSCLCEVRLVNYEQQTHTEKLELSNSCEVVERMLHCTVQSSNSARKVALLQELHPPFMLLPLAV